MMTPIVNITAPANVRRTVEEEGTARWTRTVEGGTAHLVTRRQGGYLVTRLERVEAVEAPPAEEVDDLDFASLM